MKPLNKNEKLELDFTADDQDYEVRNPREAIEMIRGRYPNAVCYDAGGFQRDIDDRITSYDERNGRVALYWETEEESVGDDGSHAIGELLVRERLPQQSP
jgi:hypothetical protein